MPSPLQITFHELPQSNAVANHVRKHVAKLDTFFDRMTGCRVAIEAPHRHKHEGRPYRISIELSVPGQDVIVSRTANGPAHEDVYAAIDIAFDELQRRLRDHSRVMRGDVKRHEHARHGVVSKLFSYEGYGFIESEEGDEIYFHRNSVLNHGFERMQRGSKVRFIDAMGDDGIHASTVVLLPHRKPVSLAARS